MIWIVLVLIALIIAKHLADDYIDKDIVEDAEWTIADYCAGERDCKSCSKYVEKYGYCKYRVYSPMRWKDGDTR